MKPPNLPEERLKTIELESAILGLRMTLTPEEEAEARLKFLHILRTGSLAIPTLEPVATGPDGTVLPNAPINLLIVTTAEGVSGVPAFTTLDGLRATLPQVENGMFLSGADLGRILGPSDHKLFVTGPDMQVVVEKQELAQMTLVTQQEQAIQLQTALHNQSLEQALDALRESESPENQEAVIQAFLSGYCRYPILDPANSETEALVLSQESPTGDAPAQEIALMTIEGALPAFTGEEQLRTWNAESRGNLPLPGSMVAQLASQAEVETILLNPGSGSPRTLSVRQGQLSLS
jgi:hypothetical protein